MNAGPDGHQGRPTKVHPDRPLFPVDQRFRRDDGGSLHLGLDSGGGLETGRRPRRKDVRIFGQRAFFNGKDRGSFQSGGEPDRPSGHEQGDVPTVRHEHPGADRAVGFFDHRPRRGDPGRALQAHGSRRGPDEARRPVPGRIG